MLIESPVINLNPGITFDGKKITTAKVRLLTRGDRKAIDLLAEAERDDRSFKDSISQLGDLRHPQDREKIDQAAELLLIPDENRIDQGVVSLLKQYMEGPKSEEEKTSPAP